MRYATTLLMFSTVLAFSGCDKDDEHLIEESALCLAYVDGSFKEVVLDFVPEYLDGGEDGFNAAIGRVIRYPPEAREAGIQGLCIVQYEISKTGEVDLIDIIEDPGGGIGTATAEALEAATPGVAFSRGIYQFDFVRVRKELRVKFKLQ